MMRQMFPKTLSLYICICCSTCAEVEKKVSTLLKYIQNKNKIPKVAKKELVGIVNDLHDQCQLLYSVYHHDLESGGRKGKPGPAAAASSSRSSSDLDYFSSEEVDISTGNVSETLSSDYAAMLRKIQETESTNEDLKRQVSSLKQEMEQAGNLIGKRNEDREHLMTKGEVALLRNQKDELASKLKKKTDEASEIHMKLKRLEGEKEKRAKAEMKIVEEKEALRNKVEKLDHLRRGNHKMHARIVELDSLQKERQMKNIDEIEDKSKKQEDTIHRLSMEIKDQKKLVKEQKDVIDKFSEDQKLMKRWSIGSKLNTNLLERKMEELSEDFQMKMEDRIRILYRRIHVAEQIHLESKNEYMNTQTQGNRGDLTVSETQFKKIKDIVEKGLAGPEMVVKKLEEGDELTNKVTRLAKEIDSARKWVHEKNSKMKHEVETLEAKLECSEAQETLLKEKLSKLEGKLGEEGTGKLSVEKAMRRIKKLEINVKERDVELMCLGEEKREAIRQLCVLVDYQRCRYDDLKTSICKVALQA
ncbi:unnamed protein product [Brassica rapa]|uniref:NAB domain-containing protein n=1 Tax=Brassica campestris TaxID=3711 RepID=A0A3P6BIM6_BRACM|nr:unnamed protein product [Brassica rapa]VDC98944.1 unnamed protein product [Brassica rapa]